MRHLVYSTHYRKELNLSEEALEGSIQAVRRVGDFADRLAESTGATPELGAVADEALAEVKRALFDDLNGPEALAALFGFIRRGNAELDKGGSDPASLERARAVFTAIDGVFRLQPEREVEAGLAEWVEERLAKRREARARRDFAEADRVREELSARGIAIEDSGAGTRWKKVR